MRERLSQHLEATGLLPEGSRILVGYSGGADSTCLLHMLHSLGYDLVAAHLHHGQRPEADDEQNRCDAFADQLGVPFASGKADVPRMVRDMGLSSEEAGRKARYAFLQQACLRLSTDLIVTGHTRSDHVETVIHHLTRGSGLAGIRGIMSVRGNLVRPLLPFSREETREYCIQNGLWFHDDPSNQDIHLSRARIRHRIVPEMRAINPAVESAVERLAEISGEEDEFLNGAAAAVLERTEIPLNGDLGFLTRDTEIAFSRAALAHVPIVLYRRAVRLAVSALGAELDFHLTRAVDESRVTDRGSVTAIGGEVVVEWTEDRLGFRHLHPTKPFRFPLTLPGETDGIEFGWRFVAFSTVATEAPTVRASLDVEVHRSSIKGPPYFRSYEPGDTMQPLGFAGHRKVSDLLSEAHLTHAARARIPIVCDLLGPFWIPGICLDERVRKNPGEAALQLRFEPILDLDRHNEETRSAART